MLISGRFGTSRLKRSRLNASRLAPTGNVFGDLGPRFQISIAGLDNGFPRIGVELTASATNFSEAPPGSITWTWNNVLGTPSGANYTPVVGDDLNTISVTATPSDTYGTRTSPGYVVRRVAPTATGSLSDVDMTLGGSAATFGDMNSYFSGDDLTFAVSGYAGASINGSDQLVIDPTDAAAGQAVTVTATNSGGTASITFNATVEALTFTAASLTGTGKVGATHTAAATVNRPGASFSYDFQRDGASINAADQATYVAAAADDETTLSVVIEATLDGVTIQTEPVGIAITRVAPTVTGSIAAQTFTEGSGVQTIDISGVFSGDDLIFEIVDDGGLLSLVLTPLSGILSVPTSIVDSGTVQITASNSGGYPPTPVSFSVTIQEAPASNLEITANGSGTVDITVDDGDTFTIMISGSSTTHHNGTFGPFDPADFASGPVMVVAPVISGTAGTGEILTAEPGLWVFPDDDVPTVGAEWISGGTGTGDTDDTYLTDAGDESGDVLYRETATNTAGARSSDSNAISIPSSGGPDLWEFTGSTATNVPDASTWAFTGSTVTTVGDN